jgi:RNA polymerase sigma factor (sigma-70 family)
MPPPPEAAEPLASRIFLGPALRTQPDRRLVKLVREGYEAAFEEIVRRYRRPLDRFAAAIVGNRSEDVTQDAFSKALLALRGSEKEIELRPWLYRIVRNTALNDLRDRPPVTEELGKALAGGPSVAVEAERREEIAELMERLRALPEPQRAAIVMRELEGLSHEEIAAALGVSGGAARQAIYRARLALRDGLGLLIPLPLLRLLFDHGMEAASAGGAAAAAGAASAVGGGTGATLGGLGAGGVLKVGVATALVAGSVGAGVAVQQNRDSGGDPGTTAASAAQLPGGGGSESGSSSPSHGSSGGPGPTPSGGSGDRGRGGRGSSGEGEGRNDDRGHEGNLADDFEEPSHSGEGRGRGSSPEPGSRGRGHDGRSEPEGDLDDDHSGEGISGGSNSGRQGPGGGGSGSSGHGSGSAGGDEEESLHSSSGGGPGGSGSGGHGGSGSSGGSAPATSPAPPPEPEPDDRDGSGGSGSGSGSSGSGNGGPSSSDDDLDL